MGIGVTPLKENRRQDDLWLDPKVGVKLGESLSQRRLLVRGLRRAGEAPLKDACCVQSLAWRWCECCSGSQRCQADGTAS